MSLVLGRPNVLTPDEAKGILTIPLLGVLAGDNQVVFPTRNRGNWSDVVLIIPIRRNPGSYAFPIYVEGRQWEAAVVPVLQDLQWQSQVVKQSGVLQPQWLQQLFGEALKISFQEAGYGPR